MVVDVHGLREEGSWFHIEGAFSEKAFSCVDSLLLIDGVFNLNLSINICSYKVELG